MGSFAHLLEWIKEVSWIMKRIISLFLIFAFLIPFNMVLAEEKGEIEIFVSLSGSDSNDGSFEKPLATLNGAKEKVKSR